MLDYFNDRLKETNDNMRKYEVKTYWISDFPMMVQDKIDYNILIGEKRQIESIIYKLQNQQ